MGTCTERTTSSLGGRMSDTTTTRSPAWTSWRRLSSAKVRSTFSSGSAPKSRRKGITPQRRFSRARTSCLSAAQHRRRNRVSSVVFLAAGRWIFLEQRKGAVHVLLRVRAKVQAEGHHAPAQVQPRAHVLLVCSSAPPAQLCQLRGSLAERDGRSCAPVPTASLRETLAPSQPGIKDCSCSAWGGSFCPQRLLLAGAGTPRSPRPLTRRPCTL